MSTPHDNVTTTPGIEQAARECAERCHAALIADKSWADVHVLTPIILAAMRGVVGDVARQRDKLGNNLHEFARSLAANWDCDTGANGTHPRYCRKCEAEAWVKRLEQQPLSPAPDGTIPAQQVHQAEGGTFVLQNVTVRKNESDEPCPDCGCYGAHEKDCPTAIIELRQRGVLPPAEPAQPEHGTQQGSTSPTGESGDGWPSAPAQPIGDGANARLRGALEQLVNRLEIIHQDSHYQSVWACYHVHGGDYSKGPKYDKELADAKAALAGSGPDPVQELRAQLDDAETERVRLLGVMIACCDKAGLAIGNEHRRYTAEERVQTLAETKLFYARRYENTLAECERLRGELTTHQELVTAQNANLLTAGHNLDEALRLMGPCAREAEIFNTFRTADDAILLPPVCAVSVPQSRQPVTVGDLRAIAAFVAKHGQKGGAS